MSARMTDLTLLQKRLEYPLSPKAIYWRIGQVGENARGPWATALAYVDARHVRRRLTEIFGVDGWCTSMQRFSGQSGGSGFLCKLSVRMGDRIVTRCDTSDDTDIEAIKGGASKALVRAATNFGIGEYLYGLGRTYVDVVDQGTKGAQFANGKSGAFYWVPPALPSWAVAKYAVSADHNAIVAAGAKCGWDVPTMAGWIEERYGVTLDWLELPLVDDALAFLAARAKDSV